MELRTGTLTLTQMQDEVSSIASLLRRTGKHDLLVSYGWACDLDIDELYQDRPLPLSDLSGFIARSEQDGVFTLGEADLYIESADHAVQFVLCHESDVHLTTDDAAMAEEVGTGWAAKGYPYYRPLASVLSLRPPE